MTQNPDPLICDFLEWLARGPRPYAEVMEAWRTSCPRLTVFEDAIDRGYVARVAANGAGRMIAITPAGRDFLAERRMAPGGEHAAPSREEREEGRR